ncbi:MAG TPA: biotin/lipoyl-containing protein, partial [Phycisphaerae bacterium]|nr:biotin/lipoyl-containing protein [Phycisphaerae bacterium]
MDILRIPQPSKTTEEGTVSRWCKAEGDRLKKGEVILEIETREALVQLESAGSGQLLKVLAREGTVLPAGAPVGILGQPGEDISEVVKQLAAEPLTPHAPAPAKAAPTPAHPQPAPAPPAAAPSPAGNVIPILMPQAGQSMEEGTMVAWRVKEGDRIKVGEIIMEIETDKATIEVEAVDAGRLSRIVVREGQTVPVKVAVGYVADNDADVDAYIASQGGAAAAPAAPGAAGAPRAPAGPAAAARPAAPAVIEGGRVRASPAARKLAAERGVDLAAVGAGSGPGGRIITSDVEAGAGAAGGGVRKRMTPMRKTIAKRLLYSKQNIPHFYLRVTVNAGPL